MKTDTPMSIRLEDYTPSPFLIDTVDLDVQLDPTATRVTADLAVRPNPESDVTSGPLVLNAEYFSLESVSVNGKKLTRRQYTHEADKITIAKPPREPFNLQTITVSNPEANTELSGLYLSRGIYCTQCEAEGFRRIVPFIDRPDVLSVYTTRIEADKKQVPVLLGNGNRVKKGQDKTTGRHFAIWHDPFPKPAYLFALVGGNLKSLDDTFTTKSGRKVKLQIFVEPGKEDRCAWAMDSLKRSMTWDEKRFGREYDLDIFMIVAVSDFNMGAMENKGLNVFNDKLILASPETATDANYQDIEAVIAHEYFHNWTGNRITCRDWFQLCLKEGLTVYRDQEFSADERSAAVERVSQVRKLRAMQFPEDAGPLAHPVRPSEYIEINNFYTPTVYEKGAEICRMLATLLGKRGFRKGMDLFFVRHDGEACTVEQFIACFEEACKTDLSHFAKWYGQAGTPTVTADLRYNAKRQQATLTLEQLHRPSPGQGRKTPLAIPVRVGLLGKDGNDLPLSVADEDAPFDKDVVRLAAKSCEIVFDNIPETPVLSAFRGFSAPVNMVVSQSDADLGFLMAHDTDHFNRWSAAQIFAQRIIAKMEPRVRQGARPSRGMPFARALGTTLMDEKIEPAFRALMAALPSETDIAREMGENVDPGAIHVARGLLRKTVGNALHDELETLYANMKPRGAFNPAAKPAGKRALRNAALSLMAAGNPGAAAERTMAHFHAATNMTDRMAALVVLNDIPCAEREEALSNYYDRFNDDHLTIDKWFNLHAMSSLPDAMETVTSLTEHELFSWSNPNKVRALVGAFAMMNPLHFHRPDGAGYDFVGDAVLRLDRINPQIAARLLGVFKSWRSLEAVRRRKAKSKLEDIAATKTLSRDVYEIVSRIVA